MADPTTPEAPQTYQPPRSGQASSGLKNAILVIVLIMLLGALLVGVLTCGVCAAALT
jgi:hypothetical protein